MCYNYNMKQSKRNKRKEPQHGTNEYPLNVTGEHHNLTKIWNTQLKSLPIIETANGVFYMEPQVNKIVVGTIANIGLLPHYTYDYNFDTSLDRNLQGIVEDVLNKEGYLE